MSTYSVKWVRGLVLCRHSLLLKTVGYRILSVIVTVAIAFVVLQDVSAALDIGIGANVVKMGVYYAYERAWSTRDIAVEQEPYQ